MATPVIISMIVGLVAGGAAMAIWAANRTEEEGARQFVERDVNPLRERVDELEGKVARLERQVAELLRDRDRTR